MPTTQKPKLAKLGSKTKTSAKSASSNKTQKTTAKPSSSRQKITNLQILEALALKHGIVTKAAEYLGVSHTAINKRIAKSKKLKDYLDYLREKREDDGELYLYDAIHCGDPKIALRAATTVVQNKIRRQELAAQKAAKVVPEFNDDERLVLAIPASVPLEDWEEYVKGYLNE